MVITFINNHTDIEKKIKNPKSCRNLTLRPHFSHTPNFGGK